MNHEHVRTSLASLCKNIAPPLQPIHSAATKELHGDLLLPDDILALVGVFGSGNFCIGTDDGFDLEVFNPFAPDYSAKISRELGTLNQLKEIEGEQYIPYPIHPMQPGLLPWGWADGRKGFYWYTDGKPNDWTVIVMYDIEIVTPFRMSMLEFLRSLLCGELDCSFIGGVSTSDNRIASDLVHFRPFVPPG